MLLRDLGLQEETKEKNNSVLRDCPAMGAGQKEQLGQPGAVHVIMSSVSRGGWVVLVGHLRGTLR